MYEIGHLQPSSWQGANIDDSAPFNAAEIQDVSFQQDALPRSFYIICHERTPLSTIKSLFALDRSVKLKHIN